MTQARLSEDEELYGAAMDLAETQQRQVLRVRKGSDLAVYGNESSATEGESEEGGRRGSNYQNRKWSMEETVDVDDDNEDQWTSNPHTLTCGFLLILWIVYAAFHETTPTSDDPDVQRAHDVKRGVKYAGVFFLTYCMLQLPDGHFVRPHPIFWRLATGCFILYEMFLIFMLFLRTDDARAFMKNFDPALGVELPEDSYAADCRLYTPENLESSFYNLRNTFFDRFVIMHFLGWIVGALMVRSYFICWVLSIMYEFYELSFRHWLANFNECWWDHLFLDIFTCNAAGIYLGMKICRWYEMQKFNWVGIRKIPNLSGKAKRALAQFTPAYWLAYDWKIFRSADRFWRVMSMVTILSVMLLNSFFLKTVLWVPASSSLNVYRLAIWYTAGSYAVAEYYIFCTFTMHVQGKGQVQPVKKLGPRAWLGVIVVSTELLVVVKHGQGMFTAPIPLFVKIGWGIKFALLVVGSSIYFAFFNKVAKPKSKSKKTQ
jgi:phosphatidylserine synthase 2